jgi:hypothetical protein
MIGVMLDQSVVPMPSFTVHGHVRPISGDGCCGGPPVALNLARGLPMSLRRGESMLRELAAPMLMLEGSGEV